MKTYHYIVATIIGCTIAIMVQLSIYEKRERAYRALIDGRLEFIEKEVGHRHIQSSMYIIELKKKAKIYGEDLD